MTFLSFSSKKYWWIKALDAGRFYMFIILLLLTPVFFILEHNWMNYFLSALTFLGAVSHFYIIYPFTPLTKTELKKCKHSSNPRISVFTANVWMKNTHYEKLINLIQQKMPEVILLTEVDDKWLNALKVLNEYYPHQLLQPQDNTYGMALYSKHPFVTSEIHFLVEEAIPSMHVVLELENNEKIQILGLHPRPPAPWTKVEHKELEILHAAGATNWNAYPTIVLGDLNDVGWSDTTQQFKKIGNLLDPRIGRGFFNSYNAFFPLFRYPIDHVFVSSEFRLIEMTRLPFFHSDHFPIFLKLSLSK
jgi:endonuclease/exonuclease/phosphatase (EEP) superfamily protein YafD